MGINIETFLGEIRIGQFLALGGSHLLRHGDIEVNLDIYRVTRAGHPVSVSLRQCHLLCFLIRHAGRICSRAELTEAVWPSSDTVQAHTVDVCVWRLRQALMVHGGLDPIETVRGAGYALK
jgi:two-component system phosphate regulon response regulator PhoB